MVEEMTPYWDELRNTNQQQWMRDQAKKRPANYNELPPDEQWAIDKELGILDWDGK